MEKAFLPPDMLYYVLRFLPALSVGPWALVCKEMRDMVKSEFRRRRCKKLIAYRCELAKEYTHIISPWAFSDAHTVQWHQGGFMFTRQVISPLSFFTEGEGLKRLRTLKSFHDIRAF